MMATNLSPLSPRDRAQWLADILNDYIERWEHSELPQSVPGYEVEARELDDTWVLVLTSPLGDELYDATLFGASQILQAIKFLFKLAKFGYLYGPRWNDLLDESEETTEAEGGDGGERSE